jgi:ribosome maturation factor RimP
LPKKNIAQTVEELVKPIIESMDIELVDIEFVKESNNWYLRIYIDKEGGVTIDDCENVSRKVSDILDEKDPIEQSYSLEVSSPGIDRPIKSSSDFEKHKGEEVEVKLYKPIDGSKSYEGILEGLINHKITIKNNKDEVIEFDKKDVALVKPIIHIE